MVESQCFVSLSQWCKYSDPSDFLPGLPCTPKLHENFPVESQTLVIYLKLNKNLIPCDSCIEVPTNGSTMSPSLTLGRCHMERIGLTTSYRRRELCSVICNFISCKQSSAFQYHDVIKLGSRNRTMEIMSKMESGPKELRRDAIRLYTSSRVP